MTRHTMQSMRDLLRFWLSGILLAVVAGVAICACGRLIFIMSFAASDIMAMRSREWLDFLSVSVRFDIKASCICFLPAVLLALGEVLLPGLRSIWRRAFCVINLLGMLVLLVLAIVYYYYFKTYDRIIDPFIFAPFKEDAGAVFGTIVDDYPLITGLILVTLAAVLYFYGFRYASDLLARILPLPQKAGGIGLLVLGFLLVYFLGLRGSLTTFPVRQINAQVSGNPMVNNCVPNGPMALYWAYKWDRTQQEVRPISDDEFLEAFSALGIRLSRPEEYPEALVQHTPLTFDDALERPNLVVALMESMSGHMLRYDDPAKRDLFGALRRHKEQGLYFSRFVSEGNGTSDSITRLLTGVPDMNLSTSLHADTDFILNSLRPFKDRGYRCAFITGGQGSWRSLDAFLRKQGFDDVLEMSTVRGMFPEATEGTWGIDDEFVFRAAYRYLQEHRDQPVLLFVLSITNHPPYRVPGEREPKTIALSAEEKQRFNFEENERVFATLRYANDELGRMIDAIEADADLGGRTVIAYTGDHNRRGNGYSAYPAEELIGYEVPFGIVLPEAVRRSHTLHFDPQRFGSHKDIMPTLTALCLSGAELHTLGCNLLSGEPCTFPYPYNRELGISEDGTYACALPEGHAVDILPDDRVTPAAAPRDCSRIRALFRLQEALYRYQVHHVAGRGSTGGDGAESFQRQTHGN